MQTVAQHETLGTRLPVAECPPQPSPTTGAPFCATSSSQCDPAASIALGNGEPTRRRKTKPPPTATKEVVGAFTDFFIGIANRSSYGWKKPDGTKSQISKYQLDQHFQNEFDTYEVFQGRRQAPMRAPPRPFKLLGKNRIKAALKGTDENQALYIKSAWDSGDITEKRCLVRIDVDAHKDFQDDQEAVKFWASSLFHDAPWWTKSENGLSGYFFFVVPNCVNEKTKEVQPSLPRQWVNERIAAMHVGLQAMAIAMGFRCTVELLGGFLLTSQDWCEEEERALAPKQLEPGALNGRWGVKVPRLQPYHTMEDLEKLKHATLSPSLWVFEQMIQTGERAAAAELVRKKKQQEAMAADEAEEVQEGRRRWGGRKGAALAPTGDKCRDAFAVAKAAQVALGYKTKEVIIEHFDQMVEMAHQIYESAGFSSNERDKARDTRIKGAINFLIRTFSNKKAAGKRKQAVWFTTPMDGPANDVDEFRRHMSGRNIKAKIDKINAWLRINRPRAGLLTEKKLAYIALTIAKNAEINESTGGNCPGLAIKAMLKYFRMKVSGTVIKHAKILLTNEGVIWCERVSRRGSNGCKGEAQGYKILARARSFFHFLPARAIVLSNADKYFADIEDGKNQDVDIQNYYCKRTIASSSEQYKDSTYLPEPEEVVAMTDEESQFEDSYAESEEFEEATTC